MGLGIVSALAGIFIIVLSQKTAKLIALEKESKGLETGLIIFIPVFGLIFVIIGLLIAFNIIPFIENARNSTTGGYLLIAFGILCIMSSPFLTKLFFMKNPNNKHLNVIGKSGFYVFYIRLGLIALTAGVLELAGLLFSF